MHLFIVQNAEMEELSPQRVDHLVPAGTVRSVWQVVGRCGGHTVYTNFFKIRYFF